MGLDQDVEGFEPGGGGLASGRLRRDHSSRGVFHGEISLTPLPALVVKPHENVSGKRTGMSVETSTRMSVA
jgi:hypothetical protein